MILRIRINNKIYTDTYNYSFIKHLIACFFIKVLGHLCLVVTLCLCYVICTFETSELGRHATARKNPCESPIFNTCVDLQQKISIYRERHLVANYEAKNLPQINQISSWIATNVAGANNTDPFALDGSVGFFFWESASKCLKM